MQIRHRKIRGHHAESPSRIRGRHYLHAESCRGRRRQQSNEYQGCRAEAEQHRSGSTCGCSKCQPTGHDTAPRCTVTPQKASIMNAPGAIRPKQSREGSGLQMSADKSSSMGLADPHLTCAVGIGVGYAAGQDRKHQRHQQ